MRGLWTVAKLVSFGPDRFAAKAYQVRRDRLRRFLYSSGGCHRFDPYDPHHPVFANRAFPIRRQIGRFCGDFWPINSRILVSVDVCAFWRPCLARCLRIQKIPFPAASLEREVRLRMRP